MCSAQGCKLLAQSKPFTEKEPIQAPSSWRQAVSLFHLHPQRRAISFTSLSSKGGTKAKHVYTFEGNISSSYYGFPASHRLLSPSPNLHLVAILEEFSSSLIFSYTLIWLLVHWRLTISFIRPLSPVLLKVLLHIHIKLAQIPRRLSQCTVPNVACV